MSSMEYVNLITQCERKLLTTKDVAALINTNSRRTLEDVIKRLIDSKILTQLERGKYQITNFHVSDFEIAQFLYSPSYISLETALNYHGVLSQFPIEITSVSTKKKVIKEISDKVFSYSKIDTRLFTGYYKEEGYLIAYPEKALFDQLYMIVKSLKTEEYLEEMDYTNIDVTKINQYFVLVSDKTKTSITKLLEKYL